MGDALGSAVEALAIGDGHAEQLTDHERGHRMGHGVEQVERL